MTPIHPRSVAALLFFFVYQAVSWSITNYLITNTITGPGYTTPATVTTTVIPTGSVTPISSNTSTTALYDEVFAQAASGSSYIVTVTDLYLAPDASACSSTFLETHCVLPAISTFNDSGPIKTRFFAPVVIQNPSSCTKTTFSYTTSTDVNPQFLPSGLFLQATASAEAVFVTTYVVTLSTDLGGQAVTTTYADVYLAKDAVAGITPANSIATLLSECVDPSSSLCSNSYSVTSRLGCALGPITYPPRAPSEGSGGSQVTGGPGGGSASLAVPTTSTSTGGARAIATMVNQRMIMGVAGVAAVYLL